MEHKYWHNMVRFAAIVALFGITSSVVQADSGPNHRVRLSRPIALGASGGNINDSTKAFCYGGTLGALVQDGGGAQYILSNNHVLAKTNSAAIGDDIIQPGLIDAGCKKITTDAVADLSAFVPIQFSSKKSVPSNAADAAVAKVRPGAVIPDGFILDIGTLSGLTAQDTVGCPVQKSGRTTGLTQGSISAVDATVNVNYGQGKTARFTNQFLVTPGSFSDAGNSGSLIVRDGSTPRAVGLLFAGSSSYTIGSPIDSVLNAFGIGGLSMVGSGDGTGDCPNAVPSGATAGAKAAKGRNEEALLNIPDVVGVGVGHAGTIEVYSARDNASSRAQIPPVLEGVPVRVTVTGEFTAR